MSQQEMQFGNTPPAEAKFYEGGYEASHHYKNDLEARSFDQKLVEQKERNAHLREHLLNLRMGMAITSLILWMIFFFCAIAIILNNSGSHIIQAFTFIGMGVFSLFVILANVLMNRQQL
ncbi:MAG TPA: hypothetical protein VFU49_20325 [Ktedonobacteraceae bacterium]|nr:hypothetical protein [Ktedonobacteraceae bacterium]